MQINQLDFAFRSINQSYKFKTNFSLTNKKTASIVINKIPEEVLINPESKYLILDDFGYFVIGLYNCLMDKLKDSISDETIRSEHIWSSIFVSPKDIISKIIMEATFRRIKILDKVNIIENILTIGDDMKFDVVIGNPPYQQSCKFKKDVDKGKLNTAKAVYPLYIDKGIKLSLKYVIMVVPGRWMTKTTYGISENWVDSILHSNHIRNIYDYENSNSIFPDVNIRGGISIFLYDKSYNGDCIYNYYVNGSNEPLTRIGKIDEFNIGIVIRNPKSYSIINKIENVEGKYYNNNNFSNIVSPCGFFNDTILLKSNWRGYKEKESDEYNIRCYTTDCGKRETKWISEKQLTKNKQVKDLWKIYIPSAHGSGGTNDIFGKPYIDKPGGVCTESFLVVGYNKNYTEEECKNIVSYISTKFFRYLVSIKKMTQHGSRAVYQFVPMQDFSKPWTDEELYKKYNLSEDEIDLIEKSTKMMIFA